MEQRRRVGAQLLRSGKLILDHARIHTGAVTLAYFFAHPEIIVQLPPKYAPELNPEDG